MSLSKDKLYREFVRWFRAGGVSTHAQAERKLSQVYHAYAQDAEDVSGEGPTNLDAGKFERCLDFGRSRSARQFAQQLDDAFVEYWKGTTFPTLVVPPSSPPCPNVGGSGSFSSESASVVLSVAKGAMREAVLPVLSKGNTADQAARKMAEAMDQVTKSAVTVYIVGLDTSPYPGPYPITNTCTVF